MSIFARLWSAARRILGRYRQALIVLVLVGVVWGGRAGYVVVTQRMATFYQMVTFFNNCFQYHPAECQALFTPPAPAKK